MPNAPQRSSRIALATLSITSICTLGAGLFLQHAVGLEPCPMCIVQRYCLIGVAVFAALASLRGKPDWRTSWILLSLLSAGFGAFTAARQSWLQWSPPEIATCGRDLYGMIESYPISRVIPMIFRGFGDCTSVDWTVLGGSIANWSFCAFVLLCSGLVAVLAKSSRIARESSKVIIE